MKVLKIKSRRYKDMAVRMFYGLKNIEYIIMKSTINMEMKLRI